jgi:CarD family transcriptional regulator
MASVKKTMKSSETKQAKQPRTRSPKATASKRSAESKAGKAAARRVLAAKKPIAKKLGAKKPLAKQLVPKQLATKKSAKKVTTKTKVKTRTRAATAATTRARSPAAKNPAANAKKKTSAAARAAVSRNPTASTAKKAAAKRAVAIKPVEAVRQAAARKTAKGKPAAATKKTLALKVSGRKAAKPAAARTAVESQTRAAQNPAAKKGVAAALLAFKRNVARLSEVRKKTASAVPPLRRAVNPANLSLESNERVPVIKENEKKISLENHADTNAARPPVRNTTVKETARAGGKGASMPQYAKAAAKVLVSKAPPPIENGPVALAPVGADAAHRLMTEAKPAEKTAAPAAKPAKTGSSQRQLFKPGEFVVYPAHGVGQIIAVEEQEVAGFKLELFVISFIKDKMILKVPTPKVISVGMRKLADASAVKASLDTLAGRARVKRTMWSRRAQEYEAKINSGDLNAIAEVVRDLYRSDTQPEQSYSERQLYEAALGRMTREIVVVQKLTETESLKVIEAQLQKGPRRGGKTEEIDTEEAEIEEAA